MSGDVGAEVTADRTWRMATLRIAGEEFSVVVPAKDADRLASALSDSAERVEAAKAEAFALRERVEDALSLAEQRQHPMDPRAATVYVADVRAALDPVPPAVGPPKG